MKLYHCVTFGQGDSVALAVQEAADLGELAVPLHVVLDGGALHEEGVGAVLLDDAVEALLVSRLGVHARLGRLHERVELLVRRDRRTLDGGKPKGDIYTLHPYWGLP